MEVGLLVANYRQADSRYMGVEADLSIKDIAPEIGRGMRMSYTVRFF